METMRYDDGYDMFAPEIPLDEMSPPVVDDATQMYWILPTAMLISGSATFGAVWLIWHFLK